MYRKKSSDSSEINLYVNSPAHYETKDLIIYLFFNLEKKHKHEKNKNTRKTQNTPTGILQKAMCGSKVSWKI